jgi:asparagine synthase (glutamine-hydrolysing)
MCGIAGVYATTKTTETLKFIGADMVKSLRHRGPDGNGFIVLGKNNAPRMLLAHTRLSINDLSPLGAQPMSFEGTSLWIVFNGEIYNFAELREDLRKKGHRFVSRSDTEVIIAAWLEWGHDCFSQFVGMWAMAIWDETNSTLVLSRDRLGIKPLFIARENGNLFFGSEPKAFLRHMEKSPRVNLKAISDYFSYRQPLDGDTFYHNVYTVEPGTSLVLSDGRETVHRYWTLPVHQQRQEVSESEALEVTASLFREAVNCRLVGDVPVGAFLSGGLDSSALVAEMALKREDPIKTFTIGFKEEGYNEFEFSTEVANHLGCDHHEYLLGPDQYFSKIQDMVRIKDAPLSVPNEIALHELSTALKKHVTVVLSGEGADELFGGYGRIFRSADDYQRVTKAGGAFNLDPLLRRNLDKKYSTLEWSEPVDHFLSEYSYMSLNKKETLFSDELMRNLGPDPHRVDYFRSIFDELSGIDTLNQYMWIFQKIHLQGLLGRLDSATMSASVEGRVPFTDHRLIEYVSSLPLEYKMRWRDGKSKQAAKFLNSSQISEDLDITKYLLRNIASQHLPENTIARKKVGFPVPLRSWLTGPMRSEAKDRLMSQNSVTRDLFCRDVTLRLIDGAAEEPQSGLQVWMLLNLEIWMDSYGLTL